MLNETVKEWIAKAEGDFTVACREMRARKSPFCYIRDDLILVRFYRHVQNLYRR